MTLPSKLSAEQIQTAMPEIMGVLNVTPDSFFAGSRVSSKTDAVDKVADMIAAGADIIDVGGEATNPNVDVTVSQISAEEECERVVGVIAAIRERFDVKISVDTSKPEVMRASVTAGATMINDQRALIMPGALEAAAAADVPVCLMHMFGLNVHDMDSGPYGQMLNEIIEHLKIRADKAMAAGVKPEHIIVDPGFGTGNYGKSTTENLYMVQHLTRFTVLNYPVLVGFSRKSMIGEILDQPPAKRLSGSLGLAILGMQHGASIIRTHDIEPTVHALKMVVATQLAGKL